MRSSEIKPEVYDLARRAEALAAPQFTLLQEVCERNTQRVMDAFQEFRVSEACFAGTTGYGYDDLGRETLEKIYARVFGTETSICLCPISIRKEAPAWGIQQALFWCRASGRV